MAITSLTSVRNTKPNMLALRTAVRAVTADVTAEIYLLDPLDIKQWTLKTVSAVSAPVLASVQTTVDTASDYTIQQQAQDDIDRWSIELKALALALVDQLNVIRAALVPPKTAITPTQALAAIRDKASTL